MVDKRSILITGGTGKIGAVLVRRILADGHRVIFTSTSLMKAALFSDELSPFHKQLAFVELRFEHDWDAGSWVDKLPCKVDTVIHNARSLATLNIQDNGLSTSESIVDEFKIAVVFPYLITQELIAKEHPLRDVVFISSMYGSVAPNRNLYDDFHRQSPIQYGVGKAAQIHIVKELAIRLAEKSIRVNAISYGGVEGRANKEFVEKYAKLNPSGKMLNEADLYPPIQYIINNYDLNVTGENIKVDGGWTIW